MKANRFKTNEAKSVGLFINSVAIITVQAFDESFSMITIKKSHQQIVGGKAI
ncbi:exported hypothetical protein [Vibrio coralliirubri]|nr:exported hypothetical protein [Vibrio coralliirubri]